jgi:uncharacterized protein involved in copper resistance
VSICATSTRERSQQPKNEAKRKVAFSLRETVPIPTPHSVSLLRVDALHTLDTNSAFN